MDIASTSTMSADRTPALSRGMIVHDMFITLKDTAQAAIDKQIDLGRKYLSHHPGQISFNATVLARGLTRHQQVSYLHNETEFTVAFHLVFKDAAAHDEYQTSDAHAKNFIPMSNPNWATLRIFDSVVD